MSAAFPRASFAAVVAAAFAFPLFVAVAAERQGGAPEVERIMRPPRLTRGNTGIFPVQEIDQAAWITHPDIASETSLPPTPRIVRFRCEFESDGTPLEFDVSGDERYYLSIDGSFVSRGPHRGTVENWMYQSYRVLMAPGRHVMEATVWRFPSRQSPLAQLSHRHGFCLKAAGAYDAKLTTGRGPWKCGPIVNTRSIGKAAGAWGMGDGFAMKGAGMYFVEPPLWLKPATVRKPIGRGNFCGVRQPGWLLFPSQLPDQTENRSRPGRFVEGGEMSFPLVVKPGGKCRILWDLGRYHCSYPEAVVKGGKGGWMTWKWAESLNKPSDDPRFKGRSFKGVRSEWKGKSFDGFGDRFEFDGRASARFQPPWFRCGRWCEICVEAADEPVEILSLDLVGSRYPLECESVFASPDAPWLGPVQDICTRAMQMCCHEMLFDCPFYEQQMYPGDTRVQLDVISSMTPDDAIVRRAIEIFALNRRDDGNVPFNYPTVGVQEGASYTLCYLGMYPDYLAYHADRAWLRARLPAMRDTLSGFEQYERADGILAGLPGWCFMDWSSGPGWRGGWPPDAFGGGVNAELNLFYLAALQGAAAVEDAFGNAHLAAHWREKAERLKPAIVAAFWDEGRGLFASREKRDSFSEHAQCLALLTDVFEGERAQALFDRLATEKDLVRTTVYFSFYLFETYFKFNRSDLFFDRLSLWRDYVTLGATTTLEKPEYPGCDSRSDCHAWGAHPLWFLRTGVAGVRSAAPFFEKVCVAPQPGPLKSFKASMPHPSGKQIEVELSFENGKASGRIRTPVPGTFSYGGVEKTLVPGENGI